MAIHDIRSNYRHTLFRNFMLNSATVETTDSIDTEDFEKGLMILAFSTEGGATRTAEIKLQESDDDINFSDIPLENIIGDSNTFIVDTGGAGISNGTIIDKTTGIIANKRYVRVTGERVQAAGSINVSVIAIEEGEVRPTIEA